MSRTVRVVYERGEDGWWTASVPSVPGCLTQGRTIEAARRNVRDALGMFPEDGWTQTKAASANVQDEIRIPKSTKQLLAAAIRAREAASEAEAKAKSALLVAVHALTAPPLRLSTRDAAAMLGLSFQRVHQLLDEAVTRPGRPHVEAGDRRTSGRVVAQSASAARKRARKRKP